MKISEAFDLYKNNYMFIKSYSIRVLQNNEYVKDRLIKSVGDKEINKLCMNDIHKWMSDIVVGRRWNTARNDVLRLRSVLKYMNLIGIECLNPGLIPVPKREETTRDYLTEDEVTAMIDATDMIRTKFVISLLYSSGIRLSELLSLDRDSICDKKFQVIGKGRKLRICFIDDRTERLMHEYLETRNDDCEALLISRINKERMTPTNVQLMIKIAAKKAGIDKHVTPHVLRHSFATNFIKNNGNIRYLSVMLGHTSMNTTAIYTHVVDNDLEKQYKMFHTA